MTRITAAARVLKSVAQASASALFLVALAASCGGGGGGGGGNAACNGVCACVGKEQGPMAQSNCSSECLTSLSDPDPRKTCLDKLAQNGVLTCDSQCSAFPSAKASSASTGGTMVSSGGPGGGTGGATTSTTGPTTGGITVSNGGPAGGTGNATSPASDAGRTVTSGTSGSTGTGPAPTSSASGGGPGTGGTTASTSTTGSASGGGPGPASTTGSATGVNADASAPAMCTAPTMAGTCNLVGDLICGSSCCASVYPYHCSTTHKCYATAAAAASACGTTACESCTRSQPGTMCARATVSGTCSTAGDLNCGMQTTTAGTSIVCCSPSYPFFCATTSKCYATTTDAAAACGTAQCVGCLAQ